MQGTKDSNFNPNVDYSKLFDEISTMCKRNQFSLKDVINDLDTKKEGRLSRFKFEKVFNYLSIYISKQILDQVIIEYTLYEDVIKSVLNKDTGEVTKTTKSVAFTDFHGVTYVDTNRFIQDYESYIKSKNNANALSSSKKKTPASHTTTSVMSATAPVTSTIDYPTTNDLIRFGNSLSFQNTSIQEVMESFDTYHVGHVPPNKFLNGFGMNNLTKKLVQAYRRPPTNDVYYLELQNDVAKAMKNNDMSKTNSGKVNSLSQSNQSTTITDEEFTYNGQPMPDFFPDFCQALRIKGIDPYLTLSAYDKHRKHSILPCHFLASFMSFDPKFSAPQIQLLKDLFMNDENKFDYMSFCEAVDCENVKYEREYQKASSERSKTIQKQRSFEDESMKKNIDDVIQNIKDQIESRHGLLGEIIESYDPRKTGKIQIKTFFKILEKERYVLDHGDQKAIMDEFSDPKGQYILYKPFVIAVTPPKRTGPIATPQNILDRLKAYLADHKISIKPLLLRLDAEKSGIVNFRQLLAVFSNISFDVNSQERRALLSKFSDQINIENFCNLVDYAPTPVLASQETNDDDDDDEEEDEDVPTKEVLDALARLYSIVLAEQNRIDLLDEFQRFPSSVDGLMNISQFRSSLLNIPSLERIPVEDVNLFTSHYTNPSNKMVSVKKFINDLTKFGEDQLKMEPSLSLYPPSYLSQGKVSARGQLSPIQKQSQRFKLSSNYQASDKVISAFTYSSPLVKSKKSSETSNDTPNNLNNSFDLSPTFSNEDYEKLSDHVTNLMRRLKAYLVKKELNSNSLFSMYDTYGNGYVLKDRVAKILSSIYFDFSKEELQQLLIVFQSQRMKNCFNYKRFNNVLENIKTNANDLRSLKVKQIDDNHPQNYELANLINTLHAKLSERHKRAEFAFYDVQDNTISADEFRERVSRYGLIIPMSQIQMLLENYRANYNNDVDWGRFCHDVNSIRTVEPPRM